MRRFMKWLALLIVLVMIWTIYVYYHLDVGQDPQEADVIIVAGGQNIREKRAKELLEAGYSRSNKVIVSPVTESEYLLSSSENQYIVNPDNLVPEHEATSTWTNATKSIKVMEEQGWESALVVTSDFHTRRTRLSFERAAAGKDLSFTYVSAYQKVDGKEVGYQDYAPGFNWVRSEIIKYWGYLFGLYHFIDL